MDFRALLVFKIFICALVLENLDVCVQLCTVHFIFIFNVICELCRKREFELFAQTIKVVLCSSNVTYFARDENSVVMTDDL